MFPYKHITCDDTIRGLNHKSASGRLFNLCLLILIRYRWGKKMLLSSTDFISSFILLLVLYMCLLTHHKCTRDIVFLLLHYYCNWVFWQSQQFTFKVTDCANRFLLGQYRNGLRALYLSCRYLWRNGIISEVDGSPVFHGIWCRSVLTLFMDPRVPVAVRLCAPERDKYTYQGGLIVALIDPRLFCSPTATFRAN